MSDQPHLDSIAKPPAPLNFNTSLTGLQPLSLTKPSESSALTKPSETADAPSTPWSGDNHPLAPIAGKSSDLPIMAAASAPAEQARMAEILPPVSISSPGDSSPMEVSNPFVQAVDKGTPVRFSSADENTAAGRQPDYFLNTDGSMTHNDAAVPSADGSINVQIQSQDPQGNKSLRDAIQHESDNQKAAAQEMIRNYQKAHPGQQAPSWMTDLMNAKPNLPDFVPFNPEPNTNPSPAPHNGFVDRGVSSHGGGGGVGGFSGNGGFDGGGNFRGNGGSGRWLYLHR